MGTSPGFHVYKVLRGGLPVLSSGGALGPCSYPKATQMTGHIASFVTHSEVTSADLSPGKQRFILAL